MAGRAPTCKAARQKGRVIDFFLVSQRIARTVTDTRVWTNATGHAASHKLGTDEMEGTDYSGSHWYNMGRCQQ